MWRLRKTKEERHREKFEGKELEGKHAASRVLSGCQINRRHNTNHKGGEEEEEAEERVSFLSEKSDMVRSWPLNVVNPLSTNITIQPATHSCGIREATGLSWALLHATLSRIARTWGTVPQNLLLLLQTSTTLHKRVWVCVCVYSTWMGWGKQACKFHSW